MLASILRTIQNTLSSVINKSRGLVTTTYSFQLKNIDSPWSTCFSSSISNLLSAIGIEVAPDVITRTVNSTEYLAWAQKNIWKWERFLGKMQVVWDVQKKFVEDILKEKGLDQKYSVVYKSSTSRAYIVDQLRRNFPVVINTSPWYINPQGLRFQLGHITTVVGFEEEAKLIDARDNQEKSGLWYIVDDPFGNMLNEYRENQDKPTAGDDVVIWGNWFDTAVRGGLSISFAEKEQ